MSLFTRKYHPVPAGPDASGRIELYNVNYVDVHTGFSPEESQGPALPHSQAKARANELTQQHQAKNTHRR